MKAIILEEIHPKAEELIKKHCEITANLQDADVAIIRTYTKVDKSFFNTAHNIKFIIRPGVGLDNINIELCNEKGVKIFNSPGSNAQAVAELTVGLMLSLLRKIPEKNLAVREGVWKQDRGEQINGKTVGIIGFGAVGKCVAKLLYNFGAEFLAYDVVFDYETAKKYGVKFVSLEELLKKSDIITLHAPLIKPTYHMIGKEQFNLMKKNAIIINTSRGPLIDEKELIKALEKGNISGAALDVFENEPPKKDNPLFKLKNVIVTSHIGAMTREAYKNMCFEAVKKFINTIVS